MPRTDTVRPDKRFGTIGLYSLPRLAAAFGMNSSNFRRMLRDLKVPVLFLGEQGYASGSTLEIVLSSMLAPDGHGYAAPGARQRRYMAAHPSLPDNKVGGTRKTIHARMIDPDRLDKIRARIEKRRIDAARSGVDTLMKSLRKSRAK